jgi:hypothetical protein
MIPAISSFISASHMTSCAVLASSRTATCHTVVSVSWHNQTNREITPQSFRKPLSCLIAAEKSRAICDLVPLGEFLSGLLKCEGSRNPERVGLSGQDFHVVRDCKCKRRADRVGRGGSGGQRTRSWRSHGLLTNANRAARSFLGKFSNLVLDKPH